MRDYSKRNFDYSTRRPKPNNYQNQIHVRLSDGLKEKIFKISEKNGIAVSKIIRDALQEYIKKNKNVE